MEEDKTLTCKDCGSEFVFTAREQEFFKEKGFSEPQRCPKCRAEKKRQRQEQRGSRSGNFYNRAA